MVGVVDTAASGSQVARFPGQRLGVAASRGNANLLRGDDVLASTGVWRNLHDAWLVPEAHAVVLFSGYPGSEGCQATDPTEVTILAVP